MQCLKKRNYIVQSVVHVYCRDRRLWFKNQTARKELEGTWTKKEKIYWRFVQMYVHHTKTSKGWQRSSGRPPTPSWILQPAGRKHGIIDKYRKLERRKICIQQLKREQKSKLMYDK